MTTTVNPPPDPTHQPHVNSTRVDPTVWALQSLDQAHRRFRTSCAAAAGLRPTDFDALLTLARREPLTHTEVANRCSLSSGAATALIDRLENAGLVSRTTHPYDRRSSLVVLTDTGRSNIRGILNQYDNVLRSLPATATPGEYLATVTSALHSAATNSASEKVSPS